MVDPFVSFYGISLTVRTKTISNMIVVQLWNDSQALQITRDGLVCLTYGPMIYK